MRHPAAVAFHRSHRARPMGGLPFFSLLLLLLLGRLRVGPYTGTYPAPAGGGGGTPPTALLNVGPSQTGYAPHGLWVTGIRSVQADAPITAYSFNWGDGTVATATSRTIGGATVPVPFAVHHYAAAGSYTVTLRVTDGDGLWSETTASVTVLALPATTVTVNPGDDVTAKLNAAAANAVIRINAGSYVATGTWNPKSGQIVWASGAVLISGNNSVTRFMINNTAGTRDVVIDGLDISHFRSDFGNGFTDGVVAPISSLNWTLKNLRIHDNGVVGQGGAGVNVYNSSGLTIDNCRVDHNDVGSITGAGGNPANTCVMACEIDHNYTDTAFSYTVNHYPWLNDGNGKLVQSTSSTWIGNNCHDNNGFGMWWDTNFHKALIALNAFTNNRYGGVFLEDSLAVAGDDLFGTGYSALVYFNTFADNHAASEALYSGNPHPQPPPQIGLWTSPQVDIRWNIIDAGIYPESPTAADAGWGIILDYSPRGSAMTHVRIEDNDIRVGPSNHAVSFRKSYGGAGTVPTSVAIGRNHYFMDNEESTAHFERAVDANSSTYCNWSAWKAAGWDTVASGSTMEAYSAWAH